jgi:hypothetical protein
MAYARNGRATDNRIMAGRDVGFGVVRRFLTEF